MNNFAANPFLMNFMKMRAEMKTKQLQAPPAQEEKKKKKVKGLSDLPTENDALVKLAEFCETKPSKKVIKQYLKERLDMLYASR